MAIKSVSTRASGRFANQLLQLSAAISIADRYNINAENITRILSPKTSGKPPNLEDKIAPDVVTINSYFVNYWLLNILNHSKHPYDLVLEASVLRSKFLGEACRARTLIPLLGHQCKQPTDELIGATKIVVHVRSGDIAMGAHRDYIPTPVSFIDHVVKKTGLDPVFVGEIDDSWYVSLLRQSFPEAKFFTTGNVREDFNLLAASSNLVLSSSTFCWAAAWLGSMKTIYFPVIGFLNPLRRPDINLIKIKGQSVHYFWFKNWRKMGPLSQQDKGSGVLIKDFRKLCGPEVVLLRIASVFLSIPHRLKASSSIILQVLRIHVRGIFKESRL